ncbi:hypothetical protein IV203_021310 [Nitzschia inconspicua]|uniref:Uncharacterized protein n=1 Tax=Nitzschia inconspicua TaxID=303405 RepID=A0A9K3KHQ1_9STRA|nr:hypothetical protein IV203_021310 [Nitzschia inconspicua]
MTVVTSEMDFEEIEQQQTKNTMPPSESSQAAAKRLALQQQRTKILLYLLVLASATLVAKQSYRNSNFLFENRTSRYLPESTQGKYLSEQDQVVDQSNLYVPSLDYRVQGKSQYTSDYKFDAHVYCEEFAKDLIWEWWKQGEKKISSSDKKKKLKGSTTKDPKVTSTSRRLMIGLYSGYDDYAKLLEQAVWSARVYGQKWGQNVTVVTLQGTSFAPNGCRPKDDSQTTLNKIRLLFHAIDNSDEYDQVLLLDADALVYNMDVDLTTLLDETKHLVAAQPLPVTHKRERWEIHSGVTLWNLNHPYITSVAVDWFERATAAVVRGNYTNDQEFLHETLLAHLELQRQNETEYRHDNNNDDIRDDNFVLSFERHECDFEEGTVVKQFIKDTFIDSQEDKANITSAFLEDRLQRMQAAVEEICSKHATECDAVTVPWYETS